MKAWHPGNCKHSLEATLAATWPWSNGRLATFSHQPALAIGTFEFHGLDLTQCTCFHNTLVQNILIHCIAARTHTAADSPSHYGGISLLLLVTTNIIPLCQIKQEAGNSSPAVSSVIIGGKHDYGLNYLITAA